MTPYYGDRDEPRHLRVERLAPVAYWTTHYATNSQQIAAVLTIFEHESHGARYVAEGRCLDGPKGQQCDPGKDGKPRARTYWQLHRGTCPVVWRTRPGSHIEIRYAVKCAITTWTIAKRRCSGRHPHSVIAGAYSGYRSADCAWPGGARRAATHDRMFRLVGQIRKRNPAELYKAIFETSIPTSAVPAPAATGCSGRTELRFLVPPPGCTAAATGALARRFAGGSGGFWPGARLGLVQDAIQIARMRPPKVPRSNLHRFERALPDVVHARPLGISAQPDAPALLMGHQAPALPLASGTGPGAAVRC